MVVETTDVEPTPGVFVVVAETVVVVMVPDVLVEPFGFRPAWVWPVGAAEAPIPL